MNPSAVRDRAIILRNAIGEVLRPTGLDLENIAIYIERGDDAGMLYNLEKLVACVRVAQSMGKELRALRYPDTVKGARALAEGMRK